MLAKPGKHCGKYLGKIKDLLMDFRKANDIIGTNAIWQVLLLVYGVGGGSTECSEKHLQEVMHA